MTEYKSLSFNAKQRERESASERERRGGKQRENSSEPCLDSNAVEQASDWLRNEASARQEKNAALGEGADYYVKTELESPFPANAEKGERALYSH